jgi:hypothetical protein
MVGCVVPPRPLDAKQLFLEQVKVSVFPCYIFRVL